MLPKASHHPINIVHLTLSLETGGAETLITRLIQRINQQSFRLLVVCLCSRGPLAHLAEQAGAKVILADPMIRGASLIYPYSLLRLIQREKADIIHSHSGCGPTAALLSRYLRIPQIHTEHGRPFPDRRWMIELERLYGRQTRKIVAVSPLLKEYLQRVFRWPDEKVLVIENGIDTDYFAPQPKSEKLMRELEIEPEQKVIGSVGRLSQVKNYPLLLHAFKQILSRHPKAKLLIVGEGPQRRSLEEIINKSGLSAACRLLGERFDIRDLLCLMDVFVLPSWSEGTSLSLLEAMSCARPVVASCVGGNQEIVQTGRCGFLASPHDVSAFVYSIQTLLDHPLMARRFGECARKVVVERYHLRAMVERYEELYRQMLFSQ
ncbi:MAG: glycosyltransferase [bacterium]|nr:glycosyltransferase [bacterium]